MDFILTYYLIITFWTQTPTNLYYTYAIPYHNRAACEVEVGRQLYRARKFILYNEPVYVIMPNQKTGIVVNAYCGTYTDIIKEGLRTVK